MPGGRDHEPGGAARGEGDHREIIARLGEKIEKYISKLPSVLNECKPRDRAGERLLDLASRYLHDARYFLDRGEVVEAFTCLSYAWALLRAGAEVGVLDVPEGEV
ncbi:DUF357 domain-containing protein [Methanopyrus kandleri]|jgi:hypothetical protein